MGWSYCGTNSTTGQEMGYGVSGVCSEEGCDVVIDHGLAYLCGEMHEDGLSCNKYFCSSHLTLGFPTPLERCQLCPTCAKEVDDDEEED